MNKLSSRRKARLLEKISGAGITKEAKLPAWARPYLAEGGAGGVLRVIGMPASRPLQARLKMLRIGRDTAPSFRPRGTKKSWRQIAEGGPTWPHRSGKPKGGWPEGGLMDKLRTTAGRQ